MRKFYLLFIVLASLPCFSQGAKQFGTVLSTRGVPLSGQSVAICTQPANTNTTPCSPLAPLGTSLTVTTGGSNPISTDFNGNFSFYGTAGACYTLQAYGPQIATPLVQTDVCLGAGSSTVTLSGNNTFTGSNTLLAGQNTINAYNLDNICVVDGLLSGIATPKYPATAAGIQAAITACPNGMVFIPNGTYPMGTTTLTAFNQNTHIRCESKTGTILQWSAGVTNGISLSADGQVIENCDWQGPFSGADTTSIGINGGYGVWATTTAYTTATYLVPTFANANGYIFHETVASCTSGGSEPAWPTKPGSTVNDGTCTWQNFSTTSLVIQGNIIEGWGAQGINSGGNSYGWDVNHNEIRNQTKEGMLAASGSQKFRIANNWFHHNGGNGFDNNGSYHEVDQNVADHNGGTGATGLDQDGMILFCLSTFTCSGNAYRNNLAFANNTHGFRWQNSSNSIMSNNIAIGNVSVGNGTGSGGAGDGWNLNITNAGGATVANDQVVNNTLVANGRDGLNAITGGAGNGLILGPNVVAGNTSAQTVLDAFNGIGVNNFFGNLSVNFGAIDTTGTNVPFNVRGTDGSVNSYINTRCNAGTSAQGCFYQYTDGATYNEAFGTETNGDMSWYDGRSPGVAGALRMKLLRASGIVQVTGALEAIGNAAALTGTGACATITTQVGGASAGSAKCTGTTGASTLTITPGTTALNGWNCFVQDETTRANAFQQTSHTTTACTLTVTSVTQNDVFVFSAIAF